MPVKEKSALLTAIDLPLTSPHSSESFLRDIFGDKVGLSQPHPVLKGADPGHYSLSWGFDLEIKFPSVYFQFYRHDGEGQVPFGNNNVIIKGEDAEKIFRPLGKSFREYLIENPPDTWQEGDNLPAVFRRFSEGHRNTEFDNEKIQASIDKLGFQLGEWFDTERDRDVAVSLYTLIASEFSTILPYEDRLDWKF